MAGIDADPRDFELDLRGLDFSLKSPPFDMVRYKRFVIEQILTPTKKLFPENVVKIDGKYRFRLKQHHSTPDPKKPKKKKKADPQKHVVYTTVSADGVEVEHECGTVLDWGTWDYFDRRRDAK